jgi:Reverse transcriptase (RNA-dependent DNA polymerase)
MVQRAALSNGDLSFGPSRGPQSATCTCIIDSVWGLLFSAAWLPAVTGVILFFPLLCACALHSMYPWERVRQHSSEWAALGASAEVMSMIQHGVVTQIVSECLPYDMGSLTLVGDELVAWRDLEQRYLGMGAFVKDDTIRWVNNCFLFPKASGGYRLIVDNRPFNEHNIEYPTELDTLHTLSSALCPNDFLSAFDLEDGYFHLAIHEDYQKYFGFRVNGQGYRMVAAPFGWSGSPQAFMVFTRAIGAMLEKALPLRVGGETIRSNSIRHRILIDDFLLMFKSEAAAHEGVRYTRSLLSLLGVGVNEGKSSWEPEHVKHHLGLTIDTVQCMFFVPPEKLARIRDCAKLVLSEVSRNARWVPARTLARLCGLVMCISLAFKGAHFFTRYIYDALKLKTSWGAKVKLSNMALKHVKFFSKLHQLWNGKKIWPAPVTTETGS